MSQRIVIINLCDSESSHVLIEDQVPDEADVLRFANDYEFSGEVLAEYEWWEIGPGESGSDSFLSEVFIHKLLEGEEISILCNAAGYECNFINNGSVVAYIPWSET